MSAPIGGGMTQLMADGGTMVDNWVRHAKETNATTPELIAMMLMNSETTPNRLGIMTILAASAIQRLVVSDMDFDDPGSN